MPKIVSQEEFIARCRKFHGDTYDYSRTVYVAAKKKIVVGCPIHGWFETHAGNHSTMTGCPQCGRESSEAAKWSSVEEFVERSRRIHGFTYDYSDVVYRGSQTPVTIYCFTHGDFKQAPNHHLLGTGCPTCGTERTAAATRLARGLTGEEFFRICREIHAGRYAYPKQDYRGMDYRIEVICPVHGLFNMPAWSHLRQKSGCQKCGYDRRNAAKKHSVDDWIVRAREVHGDRYQYDTTGWDGANSKVRIRCLKHGWWVQVGWKHTQGQGCPQCAVERLCGRWKPETMTAEHAAEPCFFYYLHFTSEDESFYKVGISSNLRSRCSNLKKTGYNIRVVHTISGTRKECLEREIATFKEFDAVAAYVPKIPFMGDGECFDRDILWRDL